MITLGIIGILSLLAGFIYLSGSKVYAASLILITLALGLWKKKLGPYLIALSIPLLYFPQLVSRVNITSAEVVILAIILIWLIGIIKHKQLIFRKTKMDLLLFIFLALTFISLIPILLQTPQFSTSIDSSSPIFSIRLFLITLISCALYFYTTNNLNQKQIKNMLMILIASLVISSLIGSYQEAENLKTGNNRLLRANSTYPGPNEFGMYLALVAPLLFSLFFYYSNWKALPLMLALALSLFALISTFSRGSWLGVSLAFILIFIINLKGVLNNKKLLVLLGLCVIILAIFFVQFQSNITDMIKDRIQVSNQEPRLRVWQTSLTIIKQHPLFGAGIGAYERTSKEIVGENKTYHQMMHEHSHNQFLHIFAERGIITGLFFIYIIILLFITNWKLIKKSEGLLKFIAIGLFAGFIAFFTQGMFEYLFFYSRNALFFWFLAAITIYLEGEDVKKID